MRIGTNLAKPLAIIQEVESFGYLGRTIFSDRGSENDIKTQIDQARVAVQSLQKVWRSNKARRKTKLCLSDSSVKSVLLYSLATWCISQANTKKLPVFINKYLKRI